MELPMSGLRLPMRVWDLPTRLFHWALAALVATSWLSAQLDAMALHFLSGYALLAGLLFRLVWGVAGSETARFSAFLRSPLAGFRHLRGLLTPEVDNEVGHNAAGGWMVLIMLALLCVQTGTGLFANDDALLEAPLAKYVGKHASDVLSEIHSVNANLILAAVAVHLTAIAAYAWGKRQNLLRPMITGKKKLPAATRAPRMRSSALAAAILAVSAAVVAVVARL
jgi:cytochrome b